MIQIVKYIKITITTVANVSQSLVHGAIKIAKIIYYMYLLKKHRCKRNPNKFKFLMSSVHDSMIHLQV